MWGLIFKIISGVAGLWLAAQFVPGVMFTGTWKDLLIVGLVLGVINVFIKPILKVITLPLRILTLGLFSLILNIAIVWVVDIIFPELIITGIMPLIWTTLIIWIIGFILPGVSRRGKSV